MRQILFRCSCIIAFFLLSSCDEEIPVIGNMTVETLTTERVTPTNFIAKASINKSEGRKFAECGIAFGQDDTSLTFVPMSGDSITVAVLIDNLLPNTTYIYKGYIKTKEGHVIYGTGRSVQTQQPSAPIVDACLTSNITFTSATVESHIISDGGRAILEKGICYSTTPNPTTSSHKIAAEAENISFNIENLSPETNYYVRAYAVNSIGTSYGTEIPFTTILKIPALPIDCSNSYIIAPNATPLLIPVKIANYAVPGSIGADDLLIPELVWTDNPQIISDIGTSGIGSSAYIRITPGSAEGNAVVAVTVDGEIKWSWHIWVTNYDPNSDTVLFPDGSIAMNRNLGAMSSNKNDETKCYGLHYQWGRKDPFPSQGSGDIISQIQSVDLPRTTGYNNNMKYAIQNPMALVRSLSPLYDWYVSDNPSAQSGDLWTTTAGKKAIYDPCPSGWRVPVQSSYSGFNTDNFIYDYGTNNGRTLIYNSQTAWFPLTSNWSYVNGTFQKSVWMYTDYWTSSPFEDSANVFYFGHDLYSLTVSKSYRAGAYSIRCVKE